MKGRGAILQLRTVPEMGSISHRQDCMRYSRRSGVEQQEADCVADDCDLGRLSLPRCGDRGGAGDDAGVRAEPDADGDGVQRVSDRVHAVSGSIGMAGGSRELPADFSDNLWRMDAADRADGAGGMAWIR